ncbi:hypothetical protein [Acinetobacter johnsonii]|uniref:hypothetical protein n=1 Tax=Acinetobacter johnsonii TaxID=40214 RepID=UPI001F1A8327|nr:hypothetical protein [Acinetobacter johnsonii]UIZ98733.1 hypothetical protein GBN68_12855 [Acinetobacter johnsonii]
MISFYISILFVISFSTIIWVFINGETILEIKLKNKLVKQRNQPVDDDLFLNVKSGNFIPKYIRDDINRSHDKYRLFSYYLMFYDILNFKNYKYYSSCNENSVLLEMKNKESSMLNIVIILRIIFFIFFIWFLSKILNFPVVFVEVNEKSQLYYYYIIFLFLIVCFMPYRFHTLSYFCDKISAVTVYWFVSIFSIFNAYLIYVVLDGDIKIYNDVVVDKNFLVYSFSIIFIIIGAYIYVGYLKFEYMQKYFELLKENLIHDDDGEDSRTSSVFK